ncbi:MAG: hypothetical protein IKQ16_00605 [Lentisphaeria bacterium]|nr:hypothetical protein [Lentisphaeria bacterium]
MTSTGGFPAKLRAAVRRFDPFPDPARPLFRPSSAELVLWLLFALVTLVMVWCHEPWRDEAQAFVVVRDNTLPGLILHMKDESQFLLWYLFTWSFVRLCGMPVFGVALMHWALSCATAYLVVRRAPFRFLTRAALIFSVLFAFEFTVVARHYAAGVFLLAVLMVNWRERFRHPVLYSCGIALCASTNLPVWTCLGGLCTAIGCEAVERRLWTRQVVVSMLVCVFGFALALASIYNGSGFGSAYVGKRGGEMAAQEAGGRLLASFEAISRLVYLPVLVCLLCFLLGVLYFAWKSVPALVFFLTTAVLMLSLQFVGGFHSMRHVGFLLVGTAAACWIASSGDTHGIGSLSRLPAGAMDCMAAAAGCAAGLILFLQVLITPFFTWCEVKYPFSHGYAASRFLRDNVPENVPMYCFSARSNVSVLPWLPGRRFFIFDRMEYGTYSKWGRVSGLPMQDIADEIAARLEPDQKYAVFVVAMNEDPNILPPNTVLLYDSRREERPVWGPYEEEYVVLAVVRDRDVESFRSMSPYRKAPKTVQPEP